MTKTVSQGTVVDGKGEPSPLRLRVVFGPRQIVGPGRVDLLEHIERTGSLAAAGRAMRMSYKRAWTLVEELNTTFDAPLVELSRGGSAHGGAVLTPLGRDVAVRYRRMLAATLDAVAGDLAAIEARVRRSVDAARPDVPSS